MEEMILRCPVLVKSKVTQALKDNMLREVQTNLGQVEQELQQIEFQAKRLLTEQARIDAQGLINLRAQIEQNKDKLMQMKAYRRAKTHQRARNGRGNSARPNGADRYCQSRRRLE